MTPHPSASARFGSTLATRLLDVTSDLAALESTGFWAVVLPYGEGRPGMGGTEAICARFGQLDHAAPRHPGNWYGPAAADWSSSLDRAGFHRGVESIHASIAKGDVYQVNLTRRLSAPLPTAAPTGMDLGIEALGARLELGNPAPHAATIHLPDQGVAVASASPELYLRRSGDQVTSSPIKGTAATPEEFLAKDAAENVMIVDLVRNDLGRICSYGSVEVPELLEARVHPGLAHLVSSVSGRLHDSMGWPELLAATFPPGSITGAPKRSACDRITELEPVERGIYCGSVGWVDADRGLGELNVAIRTFWIEDGSLHFGTGGGITWDSTPEGEWLETELKASRLIALASRDGDVSTQDLEHPASSA